MSIFSKRHELDNSRNFKIPGSLCNHHMFNAMVFVWDSNTALGLFLSLINEGYYWQCPKTSYSLSYLINRISDDKVLISIQNGQIFFGHEIWLEHSDKLEPGYCNSVPHDQWLKIVTDTLNNESNTEAEILAYAENYDKRSNVIRPMINCGTNIKMFEDIALLRDDDNILDIDERKRFGIYDYNRLFTYVTGNNEISRFINLKDYVPENEKYLKITDIKDILKKYKLGEINL